jgi:hypothetical protein
MDIIFQENFIVVSDEKERQVKEIIRGLSKDKLNTAKPGLLKDFQFEEIAIEQDENKFDKRVEIIRLNAGQAYGFNPGRQQQFAAVVYKIPILEGNATTFQLKPSNYSPKNFTEEINCTEKNIVFAIGTMNSNEVLTTEAIEEIMHTKARILTFLNNNISNLNQDIVTYNDKLETQIDKEIENRKELLKKIEQELLEL